MIDRLKFRFWNELRKSYENTYDLKSCEHLDYVVPEQSVGLKDKNGQLIYENDLIKCPSGIYRIAVDDFGLWTAIYNNNPIKGVVEWSDMVKEYAFNQENVELEVIGNIHQNQELLKDEEDD